MKLHSCIFTANKKTRLLLVITATKENTKINQLDIFLVDNLL